MNYIDLKKWKNNWGKVNDIYLWGYGKNCKNHLDYLKSKVRIAGIIDNDRTKTGTRNDGILVVHPENIDLKGKKIVVTAPSSGYEEICEQLTALGFEEYIDFCNVMLFISARAWFVENKVVLSKVHISITTACTLNCKYCNMYMPFHKGNVITYSFEQVKEQIDALFTKVDKVINLDLLGGEPLINKELPKIVTYIYSQYYDRVNTVSIVTNGTIMPSKELMDVIRRHAVRVNMSNYRLDGQYNTKFIEIKNMLEERSIKVLIDESLQWKDFSFPYESLELSDEQAYENMCKCNPIFKGFNDYKFYFCHLVWSANKAGIYKEQQQDYIDFRQQDDNIREKIFMMNICCFEDNYVSLCKYCGGCSNMNQKYISVGEQA